MRVVRVYGAGPEAEEVFDGEDCDGEEIECPKEGCVRDKQPLDRFEDHDDDVCHDQRHNAGVDNSARPGLFRVRLDEMIDLFLDPAVHDTI